MSATPARAFTSRPAVREAVPLWLGLIGPSGSGKTFSALRLATGIQSVSGGDVYVIDTEARRALHYADKFKFRHVEFVAPFGPLDYLAAVEQCVAEGARTIVIDSLSHEHEGPGGVMERHDELQKELAAKWRVDMDKANWSAWAQAKAPRKRMINTLLQLPCNFIMCFRAKEKIKLDRGGKPVEMGWQAIAGEELVYEMTARAVLPPGANGIPQWRASVKGEELSIKLPEQFRGIFAEGAQLSEDMGAAMATWAAGALGKHALVVGAETCADTETWIAENREFLNAAPAEIRREVKRVLGVRKGAA